jgi:hypothetical protein
MYDASVAIDFSPLSKIGDSFVAARESARDRALWAQYQAPDDAAPAAPQVAAAGGAATPPVPGRPLSMGQTMANGPTRMAMPPAAFAPLIKQAAAQHGVDEGMLTRLLAQESAFAPDVIDGTRRSSAGAMGIAQFMPGTAQRFGINPLDPAQAIPAAARYVAENRELLGNDGLAYAGYNWGEGKVQKWLANGADPRAVPGETRDYVQKITGRPIEAWASARGGQGVPQAAQAPQAPQGGATAAPAAQAAQMPAASAAQPGAAPAQNSAKRAALIQLLSSSNPVTRENARYLLTEMQKDDSWQITEQAGQKFFYNTRTRQILPTGLPAERYTQQTLPDGRTANVDPKGQVVPMTEAKEPRESVDDKIRIAAAGKAETKVDTQLNPIVKALGEDFETQLKAARVAPNRIEAAHETRRAIENGAITGLFSEGRLVGAKVAELFGLGDGAATSTETLRAALGNKVLENIKMLTPASNSDVKYLERVKGGTTALEASTLIELAKMEERAARKAIANFNNIGAAYRSKMPKQLEGYEAMMNVAEPGSYEDYVRDNPAAPTQAAGQPNPVRGFTNVIPPGGISGTIPGTNIPFSLKPAAPR